MLLKTSILAGILSSAVCEEYSTTAIADLMATAFTAEYNDPEVAATSCICTTVPCPVAGSNNLSIPGGGTGVYNYVMHGT